MKKLPWVAFVALLALALAACAPISMDQAAGTGSATSGAGTTGSDANGSDASGGATPTPDVMVTPNAAAATTPVMGDGTTSAGTDAGTGTISGTVGSDSATGGNDDATTADVTNSAANTGSGTSGTGTQGEAETPATTETNEINIPDDAQMLIGTWRMGDMLVRFDDNGTYQAAGATTDFDTDAAQRGTWSVTSGVLTVTPADATVCGGAAGSYSVNMNEAGDSVRFTNENDTCTDRTGMMDNVEVSRQNGND